MILTDFIMPRAVVANGNLKRFKGATLAIFVYVYYCQQKGIHYFDVETLSENTGYSKEEVSDGIYPLLDNEVLFDAYEDGVYQTYSENQVEKEPAITTSNTAKATGFVYILSNKSMPGVLKIGMTTRTVEQRVSELNKATGCLTPFECEFSKYTTAPGFVERQVHAALSYARIKQNKEFFNASLGEAKQVVIRYTREVSNDN